MLTFEEIGAALKATGIPFEAWAWATAPASHYGVYALDSQASAQYADGRMAEQSLEGTVDLFTRNGSIAELETVQTALNSLEGLSWYLSSIQFEEDTRLLHFEWVFSYVFEVS